MNTNNKPIVQTPAVQTPAVHTHTPHTPHTPHTHHTPAVGVNAPYDVIHTPHDHVSLVGVHQATIHFI